MCSLKVQCDECVLKLKNERNKKLRCVNYTRKREFVILGFEKFMIFSGPEEIQGKPEAGVSVYCNSGTGRDEIVPFVKCD